MATVVKQVRDKWKKSFVRSISFPGRRGNVSINIEVKNACYYFHSKK